MKIKGHKGQFQRLSRELRQVYTLRLTPTTWDKLGRVANSLGITKADLVEGLVSDGWLDSLSDPEKMQVLLASLCADFLELAYSENPYQIGSRDKSVLRRVLKPLVFHLALHLRLDRELPQVTPLLPLQETQA